jgi:hypothetical protein
VKQLGKWPYDQTEGNLASSYWDLLPLNNVFTIGIGLDFVNFLCDRKQVAFVNRSYKGWPQTVPLNLPSFKHSKKKTVKSTNFLADMFIDT